MLWLFPQVLLQGVIIAIGTMYSCDTETRWLFVADGDLLVLQQLVDYFSKVQDADSEQLHTTYLRGILGNM